MRRALLLGLLLAGAGPLAAQEIVPDRGNPADLGTRATRNGNVTVIEGGRRAGNNLFHSFTRFGVAPGETARWTASDAGSIQHVINRVTGGSASRIDGTIDTRGLPGASFWLINPAGILIGANARLDVAGATYLSTAGALRFADGASFGITTPEGSTFSMAEPSAFGFVGGQGDIRVTGAGTDLVAGGAGSLFLYGRDVFVTGSQLLGEQFVLGAVGPGSRDVPVDNIPVDLTGRLQIDGTFIRLTGVETGIALFGGRVEIANSGLGVSSEPGPLRNLAGPILVSAPDVLIDSSVFEASTFGEEDAGAMVVSGDRVLIRYSSLLTNTSPGSTGTAGAILLSGTESLAVEDSYLGSVTSTQVQGGLISLTGDRVRLTRSRVEAASDSDAGGPAGFILSSGGELDMEDSYIALDARGSGAAGTLGIDMSRAIRMRGSYIDATVFGAAEVPGEIAIRTPVLHMVNSGIAADALGKANAGEIEIEAGAMRLQSSFIGTDTILTASGDAGNIRVRVAGALDLLDSSGIRSNANGTGNAGSVEIEAGDILIGPDGRISSDATPDCFEGLCPSAGSAGRIAIVARRLTIQGRDAMAETGITSDSRGVGPAGAIDIDVGEIDMDGGLIASDTFATGPGGRVRIAAPLIRIRNGAQILTNTYGDGAGGGVEIITRRMAIEDGANVQALTEQFGTGAGGSVIIRAAEELRIAREGAITTSSFGEGAAGTITLSGGALLLDAGRISSDTARTGSGGTIDIDMRSLRLDAASSIFANSLGACLPDCQAGRAGDVRIRANDVVLGTRSDGFPSVISTTTFSNGDAGNIEVTAARVRLLGGFVESETMGEGTAGTIVFNVGSLELTDAARITSGSEPVCNEGACDPAGHAGAVEIVARNSVTLSGRSVITSSTLGRGDAGTVVIEAGDRIALAGGSTVATRTGSELSTGAAGAVGLQAREISIESSTVTSSTAGSGDAGVVGIAAARLRVGPGGSVTTSTTGSGAAGTVLIEAPELLVAGGRIASGSEVGASGGSGNVVLVSERLRMSAGGSVETISNNAKAAGTVVIDAASVHLEGEGTRISSANEGQSGGAAGQVGLLSDDIRLAEGAVISTNAATGSAGDIVMEMGRGGMLRLEGRRDAPQIATSSGPGTGGRITIRNPYAIVSNGGSILALGEQRGANVVIQTDYFIRSADRLNRVLVNGDFLLAAQIDDVSSGTTDRDLVITDASGVLRGQCAAARSSGEVSQLTVRPLGPFAPRLETAPAGPVGGCP